MLFNNRKPDESLPQGGTTLIRDPVGAMSPSPLAVQSRAMAGAPARCVIDAGLVITGNLESDRDVQLDGELRGDITCSQLLISRDATLLGNIVADEVVVRGKVKGSIRASQVMLQDTAQVDSEIFHTSLIVEQGAHFDGESHRIDKVADANSKLSDLKTMAADMKTATEDTADTKSAAA